MFMEKLVVHVEWGMKRTCTHCAARFYDLQKVPAKCPKCDGIYEPLTSMRSNRRNRLAAAEAKKNQALAEAHLIDPIVDAEIEDLDVGVDLDIQDPEDLDEPFEDIPPSLDREEAVI